MKRSILFLFFGLLTLVFLKSAERDGVPLTNVTRNLHSLVSTQTHRYKWVSLLEKNGKREAKDYASLVTSTSQEKGHLQLHDTITLGPSFGGMVFERRLKFPTNTLLQPEEITIDVNTPAKKVRQLSFTNGVATFIKFSGTTNTENWAFPEGILSFNALLRLAPLLPRDPGGVYTFRAYAEPFLFRVREAEKKEIPFTLACRGPESLTIGEKVMECVKFSLELKSDAISTDIWVGNGNLVVKIRDALPPGAGAQFLEATLSH